MEQDSPNTLEASGVVEVLNSKGLHARPSHSLVSLALGFESEIEIQCRTTKANAKSILEMLTLAAAYGDKLQIRVVGVDAELALVRLIDLIQSGFDEE